MYVYLKDKEKVRELQWVLRVLHFLFLLTVLMHQLKFQTLHLSKF